MSQEIQLEIVTPSKRLLTTTCNEVLVPGVWGEFGVLPSHAPLISTMVTGVAKYKEGNGTKSVAVKSGFAQVNHNKVILLADDAVLPSDLDAEELKQKMNDLDAKLISSEVGIDERKSLLKERDWLKTCLEIL